VPLFAVDGDGLPLGLAATLTPDAAVALIGALCRAQDRLADASEPRRLVALSARHPTRAEEGRFEEASIRGGVRLAGMLIEAA
jgi:hypothetical protein